MARPDLSDPAQLAAYRRELRGVAKPWQLLGLSLVGGSVVVMFLHGRRFDAVSLTLLAVGWAILIAVIVHRTRYHKRRISED